MKVTLTKEDIEVIAKDFQQNKKQIIKDGGRELTFSFDGVETDELDTDSGPINRHKAWEEGGL